MFNTLDVEQGLSQTTNAFIYKDSRGFVWISSLSGLNRFDGMNMKVFLPDTADQCALQDENIQSDFFEDDSSQLWFTTNNAINQYDWQKDCFTSFVLKSPSGAKRIGYHILHLDRGQRLWVIVGGNSLYTFNIQDRTFRFVAEIKKEIFRGTVVTNYDGRVIKVLLYTPERPGIQILELDEDQELINYYTMWDQPQGDLYLMRKLYSEGDSLLWILTRKDLIRFDWNSGKTITFPVSKAENFASLNDSMFLLSLNNQGLIQFNRRTGSITGGVISRKAQTAPSLLSDIIQFITIDRDQGWWLSSTGLGINYTYPEKKKFNTFLPVDSKGIAIEMIPRRFLPWSGDSILCFTVDQGLFKLKRKENACQIQMLQTRLQSPKIFTAMRQSSGTFWISTWGGLTAIDRELNQAIDITDKQNIVFSMSELSDSKVLLTTNQKGLHLASGSIADGYAVTRVPHFPDTVDYFPVWLDRRGRIWLNENLQKFIVVDSVTFKTIASIPVEGICNQIIESEDQETIWISSSRGLYEIDASALELKTAYDEKKGFPAGGLNSMVMDKKGKLWITYAKSVISFDPQSGIIRKYTQEDGLMPVEYTNASHLFDDGEIWFGSAKGITRFYPEKVEQLRIKAIPQITAILVNDRAPLQPLVCPLTGATNITEIKKLIFDYRSNTISFKINSLEYSSPKLNKVKYRMVGIDADTLEAASGSWIRYPNMAAGNYRLELYAANSDGVYNPQPRVLTIKVTPPYYQTWWFYTLVAMFSIGIIAYIIYLRFSKALELQKVRLKLYENLHDDVGSRLTAIVLAADDLVQNEKMNHPKIKSISQIARSIVGNMRRLVWAIDPENDKMTSIVQKINHDKSLILDDKVDFTIDMDPSLKNVILAGEIRYQISSICNEAFNNISKYAQAAHVKVMIWKENKFLLLVIEDDGIGFNPDEKKKDTLKGSGYGLANMQRRASRVGGQLLISSKPGEGTRIEARIPFS